MNLHGPVRVPANVGTGATLIKLSFVAWDKGQVRSSQREVRTVSPRHGPPPQSVSDRLTKRLVHADHDGWIYWMVFSRDSQSLLGFCPSTGGLQVWDVHTGGQIRTLRLPKGSRGQSGIPALSPDGRTLYAPVANYRATATRKDGKRGFHYDADGEITVWDVASGRKLPSLKPSSPHAIIGVRPSPDGAILLSHDIVSGDSDGPPRALTQWNLRTGKPHHLLDGGWIPLFAPDGKTIAAGLTQPRKGSKCLLWDVALGKERLVLAEAPKGSFVAATDFSRDGRYLTGIRGSWAVGQTHEVKLWETASGKEVGSFAAPKGTLPFQRPGMRSGAFGAPKFSPDGRWLAAYLITGRVYLYDVAERKVSWFRDVKYNYLRELTFSPDGRWLAVAAQDSPEDLKPREEVSPFDLPQPRIFLFDMTQGGKMEEIVAPHGQVGRMAFSPDSKTIALSGTGCVWLFDVSRPITRK